MAYSRTEPATTDANDWLVITAPTKQTMTAMNNTAMPAPVSNNQYCCERLANSGAVQNSTGVAWPIDAARRSRTRSARSGERRPATK